MTITAKDDDAAFQRVKNWLLEQSVLKRVRRLNLGYHSARRGDGSDSGTHFFWHDKRPFWVRFGRSEDTKAEVSGRLSRSLPDTW